ncbi:MAG: ABC transporter substrate-binding protein [Acidobacteria bacterium]|nr:MAG: ABC transporter substrate-binding protein [Acidobacteriota bacterium]PYX42593.1 MAG: ABC transporter substrate-binding protein [Acidobacteriota bacterium]
MSYLGRRLIRAAFLLVGVSILCFLFTEMAPGSFFDEMRLNPQISPETISSLRSRYGLDQSLVVRYGRWLRSALHADFGYSIAYNAPVAPLLWSRAKNTLLLATTGMLLTWLVSIPLGVWAAARSGRMLDKSVRVASSLLVSIPEVVIAVALLAIVVRWRVLPVGGMTSMDDEGLSQWARLQEIASRMLLPTIILTLGESAIIVRHLRASVLEVLDTPFVQAARGLGIGRMRLLFRHVLPVAASPAISLLGFSLAGLLSGSLLVEVICGWPGLGPLILDATLSRDFYLVIGGIMLSALFMVGGNLVADIMLLACDPRIRTGALDAR